MTAHVVSIQAPPSKSLSHRMVIAAALADGVSEVRRVLQSDDLERTMGCLAACGARFEADGDALRVEGVAGRPRGGQAEPVSLDVHESGTTCRLMTAVAAAGQGLFRVHGAPRMHERPIGALARALTALGTRFHWEARPGYPPFVMTAAGLGGGEITVDLDESSQYLSGLLLAAPSAARHMVIAVGGTKVVSWPYVALTLAVQELFGVRAKAQRHDGESWISADWRTMRRVDPGRVRFVVRPGAYRAGSYVVEGDWSNASYFLAAGAVGPHPVRVAGLREDSLQGDRAILDILRQMGARVMWHDDAVTVAPPEAGPLAGVTVDMAACPDIVPTVAAAACFAATPTEIHGAAHLRIKECDRLEATATELGRAGARVTVLPDGLRIDPAPLAAGATVPVTTYGDHRIAMSTSLLRLAGVRPEFDTPGCVAKSFPGFFDEWNKIVSQLES